MHVEARTVLQKATINGPGDIIYNLLASHSYIKYLPDILGIS